MKTTIATIIVALLALAALGPAAADAAPAAVDATPAVNGEDAVAIAREGSIRNGLIAIGVGGAVIGGALGIGLIGRAALESIARQPEASGPIGQNMIIAAALIEGATLFAVILGILGFILK